MKKKDAVLKLQKALKDAPKDISLTELFPNLFESITQEEIDFNIEEHSKTWSSSQSEPLKYEEVDSTLDAEACQLKIEYHESRVAYYRELKKDLQPEYSPTIHKKVNIDGKICESIYKLVQKDMPKHEWVNSHPDSPEVAYFKYCAKAYTFNRKPTTWQKLRSNYNNYTFRLRQEGLLKDVLKKDEDEKKAFKKKKEAIRKRMHPKV
tara:strand:+ start:7420 stop:8040 length:621 start_codon:yes stop_codon:yes gene_type:complete